MHASLSRPMRMDRPIYIYIILDARARQASMTCIVQGTAQNICLSYSSTKDPGNVSMHALASALRLHGCALAMCVYFTENRGFDSCTCT